jgi:hypothetical protein
MIDARHRPLPRVLDLSGQPSQIASRSPMRVSEAKPTVALRPWEFPSAARRHTVTAAHLRLRTRRTDRFARTSTSARSTTGTIVADYLSLCRNPLRNIAQWIAETRSSTRSARGDHRSPSSLSGTFRLLTHPLSSLPQGAGPPRHVPQVDPALSLRPWAFPQAARRHTIASTSHRRTGHKFRSLRAPPHIRLTTRNLAADYLAVCRNPLNDIHRWIVETITKKSSANACHSSYRPSDRSFGVCPHALHALRGRLDTHPGGRHQDNRLSSRPGTGAAQYDQLRSVRAEGGGGVGPPFLQSPAEAQNESTAERGDSASELGAIRGYFNGLIAAARSSLSPSDAAAVIRSLRTQKILAMRAAKDRHRATRSNQRRTLHSGATAAGAKRQLG